MAPARISVKRAPAVAPGWFVPSVFLRDLRVDERAHAPVVDEAAGTEHDALFGTVVLSNARLVRQVVVAGVDVEDIVFADGDADTQRPVSSLMISSTIVFLRMMPPRLRK